MNNLLTPGVVCACICDEYFLITTMEAPKELPMIRGLNETGAFFWRRMEAGHSREEIIDATVREHDINAEAASQALDDFLLLLREAGYLSMEEDCT